MKKETLEEVAERYAENWNDPENQFVRSSCFIAGAMYEQEQDKNKYSEEEVLELIQFLAEREDFKENSSMSIFIAQDFLQKFKNK